MDESTDYEELPRTRLPSKRASVERKDKRFANDEQTQPEIKLVQPINATVVSTDEEDDYLQRLLMEFLKSPPPPQQPALPNSSEYSGPPRCGYRTVPVILISHNSGCTPCASPLPIKTIDSRL